MNTAGALLRSLQLLFQHDNERCVKEVKFCSKEQAILKHNTHLRKLMLQSNVSFKEQAAEQLMPRSRSLLHLLHGPESIAHDLVDLHLAHAPSANCLSIEALLQQL